MNEIKPRLQINEVAKPRVDFSAQSLKDAIASLQKYHEAYAKQVYYTKYYTPNNTYVIYDDWKNAG